MRAVAIRPVLRRGAGLAAAVGLVALGLSGPAQAAAAPLAVTITGQDHVDLSLQSGNGDPSEPQVELRLRPPGPEWDGDGEVPAVYKGAYTIRIDASALEGVAKVKLPCEAKGLVAVCEGNDLYQGEYFNELGGIRLDTGTMSAAGDFGTIKVTGEAEGVDFEPLDIDVLVGGPEFANRKVAEPEGFAAGDTLSAPIGFRNAGSLASVGAVLTFAGSRGLSFPERYSNCAYTAKTDGPLLEQETRAVCTFEGTFEPGKAYRVTEPVRVKTADFALYDIFHYSFASVSPAKSAALRGSGAFVQGTGPELKLTEAPGADPADYTKYAELDFPTKNTYDLALTGATARGAVGDTVQTEIGFANKGPGWISALRSGGEPVLFTVEMPEGAKVVKSPSACRENIIREGVHGWFCSVSTPLLENGTARFPFTLRIDKVIPDAKGKAALPEWDNPAEPNKANNTAWIVLNPTKGEGSGGGSSEGTSGGAAGGSGASGGSGDTGGSTGGAASATGGQGGASDGGGPLASTGAGGIALIGGGALLAVGAGTGIFLYMRRRGSGSGAVA